VETSIGQRIRHKRKEFGWTQQELAKKLKDVSHVAISQWESNTTKPNAENLYELSQILGCDFGWLLKGEGENTNVLFLADPENKKIPADIDYDDLKTIPKEAKDKLKRIKPINIGQASRISGVSPADIQAILIYLKMRGN